jgi:hypothetical protein
VSTEGNVAAGQNAQVLRAEIARLERELDAERSRGLLRRLLRRGPRLSTNTEDEFYILSAIWIMANRDENPLMFYGDVEHRLRRDASKVRTLVEGQRPLFRLGVTKGRLNKWKCSKLEQAGFSPDRAPAEWQCSEREWDKGKALPAWLDEKIGPRKGSEEVVSVLNAIGKDDVFRSQWRLREDDKAAPIDIIEWGLGYLERRRKALLEAREATIKAWQIYLVAAVGILNVMVLIVNIVVNV